MKAAVYYNNKDIRIQEIPKPEIREDEILVKVRASGICGTDVMEWYRIKKAPRILGHEISGDIVESKSKKFRVSQRVFVSHHVACGKCKYCLEGNHTACETLHQGNYDPGGYSEFIRVPKPNVDSGTYVLPENLTYEEATMIEPLACTLRGQKVIDVRKGHIVLILGAGISGLLNIQIAKLRGATVVASDLNEYRIKKAKEFGADKVLNAEQEINLKADRVIICAGVVQAVETAYKCIDRKGIILLFAIPERNIELPTADFWRNEITITSSYGAAQDDLDESIELISSGKVNVKDMITHTLPLKEIQKGFRLVEEANESLKVVLTA